MTEDSQAQPDWVPPGVDTRRANVARVYDYWLGGTHNFLADQDVGRAIVAVEPLIRDISRANRAFLRRAVRHLSDLGIDQFLDLGSGIPTSGNVHEIAQRANPAARIAYVDVDPVAIAHSKAILAGNEHAAVCEGDLRQPEKILGHETVGRLIDFSRPVGLIILAVFHFVSDEEDPWQIMATLRDALAPGSYLAIAHATSEGEKPAVAQAAETVYNRSVATQIHLRSRTDIRRLFDGFELVAPGLVYTTTWRPDTPGESPSVLDHYGNLAGVARKLLSATAADHRARRSGQEQRTGEAMTDDPGTTGAPPGWVPPGVDTRRANVARVYDYWLGGTHNFLADQDVGRAILAVEPLMGEIARTNRAFLRRAVTLLGHLGIDQFLDLGSGIPTSGNVHEIAQAAHPGARVAYVDVDPVAIAHSKAILAGNENAAIVDADLRAPEKILADETVRRLIDFGRPVGLILALVLHFIADEENPWQIVATLREAMAPGSYLVLAHATDDGRKPTVAQAVGTVYNRSVATQFHTRSRAQIRRLFDGFEFVDPGLVYATTWRPDSPDEVSADLAEYGTLVGVARRN
jgi:hypothetical protein